MSESTSQPEPGGVSASDDGQPPTPPPCVVGIGCGVECLDDLRTFLRATPAESDAAIVVILVGSAGDAVHRSITDDAPMPVTVIGEPTPLAPRTLFIAPDGARIRLADGTLHAEPAGSVDGTASPVDQFFRSIAGEKRERAIGVLLGGHGTDGSLGIRAIEAEGGITLVRPPESPEGNGDDGEMPRSAIRSGIVDYVVAIDRMPEIILRYTRHPYVRAGDDGLRPEPPEEDLDTILTVLRARLGYNFHCYKKNTLARRIQRRMGLGQFADYTAYAEHLRNNPGELDELFRDLLICVTQFFRDREAWELLRAHAITDIVRSKRNDEAIRVWIPGCATGEEAYTVAMLLIDELRVHQKSCVLQVFASDINESALEFARAGMYPNTIVADVPAPFLERYFVEVKGDHHYSVNKAVREAVIFANQNLVSDPPFSKLDLICCRNLLIYLESDVQAKTIALFHFALRSGGYLFLGSAETIGRREELFTVVSRKWRLYRRIDTARREGLQFPIVPGGDRNESTTASPTRSVASEPRLARLAQQLVLESYAPAAVLINARFEVVYFSGPTHEYLMQPSGVPTHDLLTMAREGLRTRLRSTVMRAARDGQKETTGTLRMRRGSDYVNVRATVNPIRPDPHEEVLLLVVFEDVPLVGASATSEIAPTDEALIRQLEYELQLTREELQSHIEELETSNEELKAANEELQSTNEELETSKEELQSLNEELSTVNHQLQEKLEELEEINNDLGNLLTSTDIATVFLDRELCIKRFTPAMRRLLNVIPSDVGRPLGDFTRRFTDLSLLDDTRTVLERLMPSEVEVRTDDDRWYLRRALPYRTEDNRIGGVVITFIDITERRRATEALAESENRYRLIVESTADFAIFMLDESGRISTWNAGAERITGFDDREAIGRGAAMLFTPEDRAAGEPERELATARAIGRSEDERWHLRKDGTRFWASGVVTSVIDQHGEFRGFVKVMRDTTERRRMESELKQLNESLEQMVQERTSALRALSSELVLAEERERREVASDLHDSIGQTLALAGIKLKQLGAAMSAEAIASLRDELLGIINQAHQTVRSVTTQLSPPILYELGLIPALEWLCEEMERRYELVVVLEYRSLPEAIDDEVRFILFRSARELLINVAKHAGVGDARIRIGANGDDIVLEVEDNGRGFEATGRLLARRGGGFGLFSLRERLGYIGGEVVIRSTPGIGTSVTLRAPAHIGGDDS